MSGLKELYSEKQTKILKDLSQDDWFILVNHGAKRTGKTILDNDIFLQELIRVRKIADEDGVDIPQYILAGANLGTISKNVLVELTNKYGIEFSFDRHNSFMLFGVQVVQVGTENISGLKRIRGMTAYGAYVNEASLANEEVFDEIKSRCSGRGARIIADSNPDHPEHWLLKDYIENDDPKAGIKSYNFKLDDNPFLSERYRERIKASTPSGMFYERNINGSWVSGEGVVYADFDKVKNTITEEEFNKIPIKEYFAGVDWGYEHYGSIVVLAEDFKGNIYLIEEHAYQHKFIEQWTAIAKDVISRYGNIIFYCDTARTEHIQKFEDEGIRAEYADKRIMYGVETVAGLIKTGRFFVIYEKMDRFKQEIYKYVWHKTNGQPVKEFDDVLDAVRYAVATHLRDGEEDTGVTTAEEINTLKALGL